MNKAIRDAIILIEQSMLVLKHDEVFGDAVVQMVLTDLDNAYQRLSRKLREASDGQSEF